MTIAVGNIVYELGSPPCFGMGLQWNEEELDVSLEGGVAAILFDDEGTVGNRINFSRCS